MEGRQIMIHHSGYDQGSQFRCVLSGTRWYVLIQKDTGT